MYIIVSMLYKIRNSYFPYFITIFSSYLVTISNFLTNPAHGYLTIAHPPHLALSLPHDTKISNPPSLSLSPPMTVQ